MKRILVVGGGVLANQVCTLLESSNSCVVIRRRDIQSNPLSFESQKTDDEIEKAANTAKTANREDRESRISLALVLDDAWSPAVHSHAEKLFRDDGIPWLRGFVMLGNGVIGPLVHPFRSGCSQCADLRLLMADPLRQVMFQLRGQLSNQKTTSRDAWLTRNGIQHMAFLIATEVEKLVRDATFSSLVDQVVVVNLKTLDTSRHFVLPDATCSVCSTLPSDNPEGAAITLDANPKQSEHSFRSRSIQDLKETLSHDYLDYATGLLNAKVQDLITPFAAVSVNLPLLMGDEGTSGRSHSYAECEPIAILEGLERFCGLEPRGKQTVIYDSYANLRSCALSPDEVGLHDSDYYSNPDFPFQKFDQDTVTGWVWGYSLIDERPVLVPQRFAYYSLEWQGGFAYETSNGCALGGTLVEAIFHGILEVVERDAFLITWYARLPLPELHLTSHPDTELRWMIERVRTVTGYDLHFYNATMENGIPTVFVIATNRRSRGISLLCSAGAHVDPIRAVKGAIQETAGMLRRFDDNLEAKRETYLQMLKDPALLRHMEDHSMLYGLPEARERLGFLLEGNRHVQTLEQAFRPVCRHLDLADDLRDLLTIFKGLNLDVIVVNQTSPEILRNQLHCVKVIIPGMLPMTFGHQFRRLENLDRVLKVPMELGYTEKPLTRDELNPHPHPFP